MAMKSCEVCKVLGVPYPRLFGLIRAGRIPAPPKDGSGDLLWSTEHIAAARELLWSSRHETRASATRT